MAQPPTTCLCRQGRRPAACKRASLLLGLACKGSGAKPHCNTRSHRLHGVTSLARYKHTEHRDWLSTTFSLSSTSQGHGPRKDLSLFSQRHPTARVLIICLGIGGLLTTHPLPGSRRAGLVPRAAVTLWVSVTPTTRTLKTVHT